MASTGVCSSINLKGSVKIITEFFSYAINNILFQRSIYPQEWFQAAQNYGLTIFMSNDPSFNKYLNTILDQVQTFLLQKQLHRIVLVVINIDTKETIERWEFKVDCDSNIDGDSNVSVNLKEIQNNIRDIIRQITASVTYLPLIDGGASIDIILYTDKNLQLPSAEWSDSTSHHIPNAEEVQLRGFNTKIHNLKTAVAYKISK